MTYGSRQRLRLEGQAAVEGETSMLKRTQGISLLTILLLLLSTGRARTSCGPGGE